MNAEPPAEAFETKLLYSHLWLLLRVVAASITVTQHDEVVLSSLFLPLRFATLMIVANSIVAAMDSSTTVNTTSMMVATVVDYSCS